jgi:hypothetical protein
MAPCCARRGDVQRKHPLSPDHHHGGHEL